MLRTRIIPVLLLQGESLVKTVRFSRYSYIGDPCNTVRIFNELEVDELMFLDITATNEGRAPNLKLLADIANECFMPLGYGGGIRSLSDAEAIFKIGFEKIVVNTISVNQPELIRELSERYGSQAVVVSIDVKKSFWGNYSVWTHSGQRNSGLDPINWAKKAEALGAGEILLTTIEREGTWSGFDLNILKEVSNSVSIPVVAHGGAGSLLHIREAVIDGGASAVALGSLVVFQKRGMGVLVSFPEKKLIEDALA